MSVLLQRLVLAASLSCAVGFAPAFAQSDDDKPEDKVEKSVEAEKTEDKASDEEVNEAAGKLAADKEWADKVRKRQHEGDVALGVCGGRMSALMWFYQSLIADGRTELEKAFDAVKESREVLKTEAERRAVDDGIATSVNVMNEHSEELWEGLLEVADDEEKFQTSYNELYANVQECLNLFFNRAKSQKLLAEEAETEAQKAEEAEKTEEPEASEASEASD